MTYTPVNGTRPMVMDFAPQAPDVNQMSKDGSFTDEFAPREDGALSFSDAVNQELQLLLSLSPR